MGNYKFGLVCISTDMQEAGYKFQTMTRKRFNELVEKGDGSLRKGRGYAISILFNRIVNNLVVTAATIRHCGSKGIAAYRLSSDLFPLVTDPTLDLMSIKDSLTLLPHFENIKSAIRETGVRISTHPDQWNSLASLNSATIEQTIRELNFHGWLLDRCGAERSHWNPINIHVGLSGKDLAELPNIRDRFVSNFDRLDDSVKSRLCIENDDKGLWTCENLLLYFANRFPLCFDEHHDLVNPSVKLSHHDAFQMFIATWVMRAHPEMPLFHYSESIPGEKNPRAHADFATRLPMSPQILDEKEIYWDIELKGKDRAIYKMQMQAALEKMSIPNDEVD